MSGLFVQAKNTMPRIDKIWAGVSVDPRDGNEGNGAARGRGDRPVSDHVQKVPMPEGMSRPETGVMQFGDDWPGVFIRGDNALLGYAPHLRVILDMLATHSVPGHALLSVNIVTGLV